LKPYTVNQQILESERIFKKAVERADIAFRRGDLNSVVAWAKIAAHFAFVRHPGFYTDSTLENLLLNVAQKLEKESSSLNTNFLLKTKPKDYSKMRFLHVITESYGTGGHSSFIARWIKNSSDSSVHSLVMTAAHNGSLTSMLSSSVTQSGGWYCSLSEVSQNLLEQALFLRQLARNWADVVVLFIHPFDPLPTVAFGINGGPPIIFCNHADHAFWLGSSVADVMADYHSSGGLLSAKRRGTFGSKVLPIPLPKTKPTIRNTVVRKELGLRDDDVMLLTIARDEKFLPFGNYDFLEVLVRTLKRHPKAKLFAVGPIHQGRWEKASALVDGRIKALGALDRSVLETYYDAADLYVGSFPCGSGTALLEAGIHDIPLVGLHIKELPHLSGGDDVAFQKLSVHASSINEFTELLEFMINDCYSCRQKAMLVKENIEREHCSPGWNAYLDDVLQSLPSQHSVRKPKPIGSQTDYADVYFSQIDSEMLSNELPEHSFGRLVRVYARHLPKTEVVNAQAKSFIEALPKVDSLKKWKEYLYNLREFLNSAFN
jgi:hypothetical protein